jgi:hypothetical protein
LNKSQQALNTTTTTTTKSPFHAYNFYWNDYILYTSVLNV